MEVKIEPSWKKVLQDEFLKDYFIKLTEYVRSEYSTKIVYPPGPHIFHAFDMTPFDRVKVVVLGQDPYHNPREANGLAFSVNEGVRIPPSLKNIYTEIFNDLGNEIPKSGNLDRWAKQGVLLLNATLTVRAHAAGSHQNKGWEIFTDAAIKALSDIKHNIVFLLWGTYAQKKGSIIDTKKHLILSSAHPSPFSADRGFFGNKHFSKANKYLEDHGIKKIDW